MNIKLGVIHYAKLSGVIGEELVYLVDKTKNSIVVMLLDNMKVKKIKYKIYNSEGDSIIDQTFDIFNLIVKTRYMNTKVLNLIFEEKNMDLSLLAKEGDE